MEDEINLYEDDASPKSPIPKDNENVYIYDTSTNFFNISNSIHKP